MNRPDVLFNYLGRADRLAPDDAWLRPSGGIGRSRGPDNLRHHWLEIDAMIVSDTLQVEWTYSENAHRRATVEALRMNRLFIIAIREEEAARGRHPPP